MKFQYLAKTLSKNSVMFLRALTDHVSQMEIKYGTKPVQKYLNSQVYTIFTPMNKRDFEIRGLS